MVTKIRGLALTPRESVNGRFYHRDELAKFDGRVVPVFIDHERTGPSIGTARFSYDTAVQQVLYEAIITDPEWQKRLDKKKFQVSVGSTRLKDSFMCDHSGRDCLYAPILGSIDELSIMWNLKASIPESTAELGEGVIHKTEPCGCVLIDADPEIFTSDKPIIEQERVMTEPIKDEKPKTELNESVQAQIPKPVEIPAEVAKVPEKPVETPKPVEAPVATTKIEVDTAKISKEINDSVNSELTKVIKEVRDAWIPKSELNESVQVTQIDKDFTDEEAQKILAKLDDNGYVKLKIDKENFIESNRRGLTKDGKLTEAVVTSGTIPGVTIDTEIVVTKAGKTELSLRPWGKFKAIPTGQNTARFYRITIPDAGAITESPTTDITASTHTLTALDVTCAVRGWRQNIERSQFEDYPATFLNAIKESARIEAIRDEHRLIVQDLAATDHDFAGATATATLAFHINGADGSAVTTTTLEDACGEFDEDGLSFAKRYLQQGSDPSIGINALVAFLAPRAFESLYTSSGIANYTGIGNPSVTRLGQLEMLYGIDIVLTNELLVANNSYRNLVCIKGKCWALVSQRDMNIQLQDIIKGQTTDVVWTHRIGVDALDCRNYVIVSSKQD